MGRQPAMTKLGAKRIYLVRCRGGNIKHRAIRLDTGSFSWTGEGAVCFLCWSVAYSAKTKILNIVYNASNNELVRTNTLVKGCIVSIDATPFKAWFEKRYSCKIGAKGEVTKEDLSKLEGVSKKQLEKLQKLQNSLQEQKEVIEQLASGKILARISSRPGQSGRADGYILEDDELAFYHRKINQKKK